MSGETKTRRRKVSGHGSTAKAGKVRGQTPKIPKTTTSKRNCPRLRNRRKYEQREGLGRKSGQNWVR